MITSIVDIRIKEQEREKDKEREKEKKGRDEKERERKGNEASKIPSQGNLTATFLFIMRQVQELSD